MRVSWQPLSLSEARGFVQFYTIAYTPILNTRKRQDSTMRVDASADASSVNIDGLTEDLIYSVDVSAGTRAGRGIQSNTIRAEQFDTGTACIAIYKVIVALYYTYFIRRQFICNWCSCWNSSGCGFSKQL